MGTRHIGEVLECRVDTFVSVIQFVVYNYCWLKLKSDQKINCWEVVAGFLAHVVIYLTTV
jgi:hypothetical protein